MVIICTAAGCWFWMQPIVSLTAPILQDIDLFNFYVSGTTLCFELTKAFGTVLLLPCFAFFPIP